MKNKSKILFNRFYLIVKVTGSKIGVLNASSLRGKESRLYFESNYLIEQYYPPFPKETFIKLDSYMEFDISEITDYKLFEGKLNDNDLNRILKLYKQYN